MEWVGDGGAGGAGTLSLLVGRQCCKANRPVVLVDFQRQIYPVALAALGFDLSSLVVVRPGSERDALWAYWESLRCQAVALVWARVERLTGLAFRRLQMAAEQSGGIGFLVRPLTALGQPSWADVCLAATPMPGGGESPRFKLQVAYSRGKPMRSAIDLEIDAVRGTFHEAFVPEQTHRMSLVS